ncbi:MAG: hypothetical protein KF740_20010 [Ramlibacter sp.]|nr:hypothetical protein [Ramlibacter sp.]
MKHASDRATSTHTARSTAVDIDSERGTLTLTIKIALRGVSQRALLRRPERLRAEVENLVEGVLATPRPTASVKRLAAQVSAPQTAVRTTQAQGKFGVTSSSHIHQVIANEAEDRDLEVSALARELFERGLSRLEERLWDESSTSVLADFARTYEHFETDENKQWSLRVPRKVYIRGQLLAKEHELSRSRLACWCLAMGLELEVAA